MAILDLLARIFPAHLSSTGAKKALHEVLAMLTKMLQALHRRNE
jgi:hypothetical protein